MFPMGYGTNGDEAGTYDITVNQETTSIEADSIEYADDCLRVWKGGLVVATFRWWDSVVKKS